MTTFLVLYFTFCKIDFLRIRLSYWHLHIALAQLVLACLALIVCLLSGVYAYWYPVMQAVLACVVAPSASAAAVVTAKLGGELEQMITFTLFANLISAVLIPLLLPHLPRAVGFGLHNTTYFDLMLHILWRVVAVLLLPMLTAWLTKRFLPVLHQCIIGVRNLSFYAWAISLMLVSGTAVMDVVDLWATTPVWLFLVVAFSALVVCLVQFFIGNRLGVFTGHCIEAGQGLGQKNTAFAIWLSASFLHPLACLGPGSYILWQNLINSWQIRRAALAERDVEIKF